MAERRVFAGYYKRYDGKPIFVIRVLKDIDTGEAILVCKDASFSREDNEHYYLIRYASFCEQVEVDGVLRDKYVRQTQREINEGTVREVYEYGFSESKSKPFTYVDDEYAERAIRCSRIAAWSSGGRPRSIGRSPSFCRRKTHRKGGRRCTDLTPSNACQTARSFA